VRRDRQFRPRLDHLDDGVERLVAVGDGDLAAHEYFRFLIIKRRYLRLGHHFGFAVLE